MSILVIDLGSTSVRAALVDGAGRLHHEHRVATPLDAAVRGLAEFDPVAVAAAARDAAESCLAAASGGVEAVGIANQRASTVLWNRRSGEPLGPGLGWQDLRTALDCLELQSEGLRLAPNQPATKAAHLIAAAGDVPAGQLCVGTLDSWLVWTLTGGAHHVTDATNAAVTGLVHHDRVAWDPQVVERLGIPPESLPEITDSSGTVAPESLLPGRPPITGLVGDQQAALVGAGRVRPGDVKITFGTGGMLDVCLGPEADAPPFAPRGPNGTFPIVAWQEAGRPAWGIEAMMLSAGSSVDWLCELGLLEHPAASHPVAAGCDDTGGVMFVPAPLGLGTPLWDFGARSAFVGMTTATTRAQLVRAVLEGVAHRGADLLEAAQADSGHDLAEPVIDGGMSNNPTFAQALADAAGRPVRVAAETECTALGAAYLAGLATGTWRDWPEVASLRPPRAIYHPRREPDRERWREATERAAAWHPDLSSVSF